MTDLEQEEIVYQPGDRVVILSTDRKGTVTGKEGAFYNVTYDEPVFASEVFVMYSPEGKQSTGGLIRGGGYFWFSLKPLSE